MGINNHNFMVKKVSKSINITYHISGSVLGLQIFATSHGVHQQAHKSDNQQNDKG